MITDQQFEELKTQMSRHFFADYPREACGIITTDWQYVACKNISPNPKDSFILNPIDLLKHEDTAWGIVHSHPGSDNPIPSERDVESTIFDCYKFIVGFSNRFFIYWFDKKLNCLIYEELEPRHFND